MRFSAEVVGCIAAVLSMPCWSVADQGSVWVRTADMPAAEAFQAAAADAEFVFAITNRQVSKYDRVTGRKLATSRGKARHLNSGFLWQGELLCAHSNYPLLPERSEIKSLDLTSMELTTFRRFEAPQGSLTWVVRHNDHWWCNFARYGANNIETFLAKLDNDWIEQERWTYPASVISQLGRFSISGGIWRNNELIVTGHDRRELYRLRLPQTGDVLEFVAKQPAPFTGQGIAQDLGTGGLVGIDRKERRVIFARLEKRKRL